MTFLYWLTIGLLIFVALVFIIGSLLSSPPYRGPISDHFDGKKFNNYGDVKVNGIGQVFKMIRTRQPTKWVVPENVVKKAEVIERVEDSFFRVTLINHATILIQLKGINILTDPVYARAAGLFGLIGPPRQLPSGIDIDDLPPIDFVFISHNHYDHLDTEAIQKILKKHRPKFITTLGNDLFLKKYVGESVALDWWDELKLTDEITLVCTPSQHFSSRGLLDRDTSLWGGFVLKTNSGNIYWTGDSGYGDFFRDIGKKLGPFRFSCIPIGAYLPRWFMSPIHVNPDEAVQIHLDVQSQKSMAFHWGTFNLSDEGWDEPVKDLEKALIERGISNADFEAVVNGTVFFETF